MGLIWALAFLFYGFGALETMGACQVQEDGDWQDRVLVAVFILLWPIAALLAWLDDCRS